MGRHPLAHLVAGWWLERRQTPFRYCKVLSIEEGVVYHTYPTCARGLDGLQGVYQWRDAPEGRNGTGVWWRRHDEYDQR